MDIASRPRTLKELAALYGISPRALRRQLRIAGITRPVGSGYYYTIRELQAIAQAIGQPDP